MRKLLLAFGLTMMACGAGKSPPPPVPDDLSVTQSALQDQFRQLWAERVFYSRALMISTMHGLGDRELLSARLRKNNQDLGAAFDVFYASVGAGAQIASFLDTDQDHLETALNTAAEGHHVTKLKRPWKDSIKELSHFLESLNSELSVDGRFDDYVDHAFNQIEQRQVFDWVDDVNALDGSVKNANKLADDFAKGFLKQYPDHVPAESNEKYQKLRSDQRKLWMDHFMWHHFFNLSTVNVLPDLQATRQRMLLNSTNLGNSFKPYYGALEGERFAAMLRDHVLNSEQVVHYIQVDDQTSVLTTKAIGLANADQIAQFLSNVNPNLPLEVTRPNMLHHLQLVYDDIDAQFAADFARELGTLEEFEAHLLETADAISSATQTMFPDEVNQKQ